MSKMSLSVERQARALRGEEPSPPAILPTSRARLSETSLELPPDYSFEEWEQLGIVLSRMDRSVQWWIGDWIRFGESRYGEMYSQALDATGRDYSTLQGYVYTADRVDPLRRRNNLSWGHHREVAPLSPDDQDRLLSEAETEGWSVMDLRAAVKRGRVAINTPGSLPTGKYAVILADPPWRYEFNTTDAARAIENQYPTLDADEIACLEDVDGRSVADLAADDAVLFMWATNPKLAEALVVIEGWGFKYTTNLAWVKDRIGMGYWARQRHELLLVAVRGEMAPPPEHLRRDSVIEAPRRAHSEKPSAVHEYIEAVWPDVPKVELFAREARPGWAVFGNQAPEAAA